MYTWDEMITFLELGEPLTVSSTLVASDWTTHNRLLGDAGKDNHTVFTALRIA